MENKFRQSTLHSILGRIRIDTNVIGDNNSRISSNSCKPIKSDYGKKISPEDSLEEEAEEASEKGSAP